MITPEEVNLFLEELKTTYKEIFEIKRNIDFLSFLNKLNKLITSEKKD
ncbi:MAG: hypothetical protein NC824_03330 [Candidatus Omnitrophica bacterium]|nr:hypothetical protein [Candidatus Omnitrophota bacterium]